MVYWQGIERHLGASGARILLFPLEPWSENPWLPKKDVQRHVDDLNKTGPHLHHKLGGPRYRFAKILSALSFFKTYFAP